MFLCGIFRDHRPLLRVRVIVIGADDYFAGAFPPYGMFEYAGGGVCHRYGKPHEQDEHDHTSYRFQIVAPAMHRVRDDADERAHPHDPYLREQRHDEIEYRVVTGDIDEFKKCQIDDF